MSDSRTEGDKTFAEVLSRAVQARGLSLDRIRARLEVAGVPVSNATLSYWQSGRSLPTRARSLRTLVELETILDLEQGSLIELIRTADGRTRHHLFAWQSVLPGEKVAEQIIADMGIEGTGRLSRVTIHDTVSIRPDRTEQTQLTRQVLRAERSGVQSWPVVVQQDTTEAIVPEVEAVFGCRVGQVVEVPDRQLSVVEMVLMRPLQRGETVMAEHLISYAPSTTESFRVARHCPEALREVAIGVQFHAKAVPAEVRYYNHDSNEDFDRAIESPIPVEELQAQVVKLDVNPGIYGLRWSWD